MKEALIYLVIITLTGHLLCAVYLVKQRKKAGKAIGMWPIAALQLGLFALALHQYKHGDEE